MEDVEEGASWSRGPRIEGFYVLTLRQGVELSLQEHPKSRHQNRSFIDTNRLYTRDPKQERVYTY